MFDELAALAHAGWTFDKYTKEKQADERSFEDQCQEVLDFLLQHENSWPFRNPVDADKVRDYYEVIEKPMDLETVQKKVDRGLASPEEDVQMGNDKDDDDEKYPRYTCMEEFKADIK